MHVVRKMLPYLRRSTERRSTLNPPLVMGYVVSLCSRYALISTRIFTAAKTSGESRISTVLEGAWL